MISIYRQHGEYSDQLNALSEHVFHGDFGNIAVVGCQRKNTSGHGIHDIFGRCFHDHIPDKICGQIPAVCQCL